MKIVIDFNNTQIDQDKIMQFTKVDKTLQKEYDELKERFHTVEYVEKDITITTKVTVNFIWEGGLTCTPEGEPETYLNRFNANTQLEEKMNEIQEIINKDIEQFWDDLEKFAKKANVSIDKLLESF
jgi:hypothetical protein